MQRSWCPKVTLLAVVGIVFCLPPALAACGSSGSSVGQSSPSSSPASLESTDWRATEIAGSAALSGPDAPEVTAVFASSTVSGSAGVNKYSASYTTTSGGGITISTPTATTMAGPPAWMTQEQAYFTALAKATRYAATANALTLTDDQGTVLVRYAAQQAVSLGGTTWDALAYNNGKQALVSLEASSSITAVFGADGTLTGNATINHYSTGYKTSGDTMSIDAAIAASKKAGPEKLMQQEAAYLAALPKTATYGIEGDELWLRDASGAALALYKAK